jgi:hypothetical protein
VTWAPVSRELGPTPSRWGAELAGYGAGGGGDVGEAAEEGVQPRTCCPGSCACPTAPHAPAGRCSWPAAGQCPRRPAHRDICPHAGRGLLAYDRAGVLFKKHTGGLDLHQLRHSAATHPGDQKVPLQLIMAKTRHKSPRTVLRYVKPGDEAVAEVTSLLGPPRRTQ